MNKTIYFFAFTTVLSAFAQADNCTKQIDGYTAALRSIETMEGVESSAKEQAVAELKRVVALREEAPDCAVAEQIEVIRKTKAALRAADTAVDHDNTAE